MDIIYLKDLRIDTVIGIFEWERRIKQNVRFDLEMGTDIKKAAASDDIIDTLDYKTLAKRVISFVESSSFNLVETLAESVARLIVTEFAVPYCKVTLNKAGAVRGASGVGIMIERRTEDFG